MNRRISNEDLAKWGALPISLPSNKIQGLVEELIYTKKELEQAKACIRSISQPFNPDEWPSIGAWLYWKKSYVDKYL